MAEQLEDVRAPLMTDRLNSSRPYEPEDPAELERWLERNARNEEFIATQRDPSEYVRLASRSLETGKKAADGRVDRDP